MKILVFTYDYPYGKYNNFAFVKQLVDQFAVMGHDCTVVSPWPIIRKKGCAEKEVTERHENGGSVTVLRPNYLTIPFLHIGSFYPSQWFRDRAVRRAIKRMRDIPDVVYCHFWRQGLSACPYAQQWGKPLFVASGESNIATMIDFGKVSKSFLDNVRGVICVSSKSRDESIDFGLATPEKCVVLPNAVDSDKFHKIDKAECRRKLGIPVERFVICFVGWFIERKGPLRLAEAVASLNDDSIGVLYVGEGPQVPKGKNILFKGSVLHDNLPLYLNAADVFVLPTLNEGCCNAIVEAMACGLPVISSDMDFNKDILDDTNSILVNPSDVNEIARTIRRFADDKELRLKLSEGALSTAKGLSIDKRAEKIINFIEQKTKQ